MAKLIYNFTFPFRWLKEDRKFLKQNLEKSLPRSMNKMPMSQELIDDQPIINIYAVRFKQHSYQPKAYVMTAEEVTELLSDALLGARCARFEKFFVQKNSPTGLPVMELELYLIR